MSSKVVSSSDALSRGVIVDGVRQKTVPYHEAITQAVLANGCQHTDKRPPGVYVPNLRYECCLLCVYSPSCGSRSWPVQIVDWCSVFSRAHADPTPPLPEYGATECFWRASSWYWWDVFPRSPCCSASVYDKGTICERIPRCTSCGKDVRRSSCCGAALYYDDDPSHTLRCISCKDEVKNYYDW